MEDLSKNVSSLTASTFNLIDKNNPVFSTYVFWSSLLIIKVLLMSMVTAAQRYRTKTPASPEDARGFGITEMPAVANDDVERVRRAHLNDLENILPYLTIGLFYVLTDPASMVATNLFRVATIARFVHSFVYAIYVIPQPARALSFAIHYFITIFMAIMSLIHFFN